MNTKLSLVEQAAHRLEELQRAGVTVPWEAATAGLPAPKTAPVAPPTPAMAAMAAALAARAAQAAVEADAEPAEPERGTDPDVPPPQPPARSVRLDLERLKEMGYLVPDQLRSDMAQQFRNVKRPLLKTARAEGEGGVRRARHIMVTSALAGEGKTFFSLNLAMSMAMEVDTAVLLVDADVVRPTLFKRYGLDVGTIAPYGLLDYLTGGEPALHQLMVSTNVPKLTLMSSGRSNHRSSELLSSDAMEQLLDVLSRDYADHVVIFDAPPVLLTTESIALASKVGQVVVVVENGKTPKSAVKSTFDALRLCPNVSAVLNKCEAASLGDRYGYYYE
jgi:receptor protein-tyrosine kinase